MQHLSSLLRISADEEYYKILHGMKRAVELKSSEQNRKLWGNIRRSVTFKFVPLSDKEYKEGLGIQAATLRECVGDAAETQLWVTGQKIEFIVEQQGSLASSKPLKLQQVSVAMLAAHLGKNVDV